MSKFMTTFGLLVSIVFVPIKAQEDSSEIAIMQVIAKAAVDLSLSWMMQLDSDSLLQNPVSIVQLQTPLPGGQIMPGDSCVFSGISGSGKDEDNTLSLLALFVFYKDEGDERSIYLNNCFWIPNVKLGTPLAIMAWSDYVGRYVWPQKPGKRYLIVINNGNQVELLGGPWELNYLPQSVVGQRVGQQLNRISLNYKFRNYPNPFNSATIIEYSLSAPCQVFLEVVDIQGREVAKLIDKYQLAGEYRINWNASGLPVGIYLYHFQAGELVRTGQMMVLK